MLRDDDNGTLTNNELTSFSVRSIACRLIAAIRSIDFMARTSSTLVPVYKCRETMLCGDLAELVLARITEQLMSEWIAEME